MNTYVHASACSCIHEHVQPCIHLHVQELILTFTRAWGSRTSTSDLGTPLATNLSEAHSCCVQLSCMARPRMLSAVASCKWWNSFLSLPYANHIHHLLLCTKPCSSSTGGFSRHTATCWKHGMSHLFLQAKDALNCSTLSGSWFQVIAGCTLLTLSWYVIHKGRSKLRDHAITCWCCPSQVTKYVFQTWVTAVTVSADSLVHVMQQ